MSFNKSVNTNNEVQSQIPDASQVNTGTPYYKPESNLWSFKLGDEEYRENYKVWDQNEKKFKSDKIIDAVGREQLVKNTQFMTKNDFELAFPNCKKNTTYDRYILIDHEDVTGVEYKYRFKRTQNDQIIQQIETIKGLGQDPLNMLFTLEKKTKSGNPLTPTTPYNDIEYKVSAKPFTAVVSEDNQKQVQTQGSNNNGSNVLQNVSNDMDEDTIKLWKEYSLMTTMISEQTWHNFIFNVKKIEKCPENEAFVKTSYEQLKDGFHN